MPGTGARRTRTLLLPRGAQIEVEYNPRRPSIRTIVSQVEALGYRVVVRPLNHQPFHRDINNRGLTSHRLGLHLLLIYPPPFDPQRNEEEIARERNQQIIVHSIEVEITADLYKDGQIPYLEIDDKSSEYYGLTVIEYQGAIIEWLQREYGEHVEVEYTLYEEYLASRADQELYRATLSDLLLLNRVIKRIVHGDARYLPENPEFEYECLIYIQGTGVGFQIERGNYEFRRRRLLTSLGGPSIDGQIAWSRSVTRQADDRWG